MASFKQRGKFWQARVRRRGWPDETKSFKTKNEADAELFGMDYEGLFPKDKPYLRWHHFKDIGSADKMYQIMNDELFPFNRSRWFAGNIVGNTVNSANFVDNSARNGV